MDSGLLAGWFGKPQSPRVLNGGVKSEENGMGLSPDYFIT